MIFRMCIKYSESLIYISETVYLLRINIAVIYKRKNSCAIIHATATNY